MQKRLILVKVICDKFMTFGTSRKSIWQVSKHLIEIDQNLKKGFSDSPHF